MVTRWQMLVGPREMKVLWIGSPNGGSQWDWLESCWSTAFTVHSPHLGPPRRRDVRYCNPHQAKLDEGSFPNIRPVWDLADLPRNGQGWCRSRSFWGIKDSDVPWSVWVAEFGCTPLVAQKQHETTSRTRAQHQLKTDHWIPCDQPLMVGPGWARPPDLSQTLRVISMCRMNNCRSGQGGFRGQCH